MHTHVYTCTMDSLSNETLARVRECATTFSKRLGSKYRASGLESSSMKLAVVTALRFHFSVLAISFSFSCADRERGGGKKRRRGRREREGGIIVQIHVNTSNTDAK